jgi:hypothetical protein
VRDAGEDLSNKIPRGLRHGLRGQPRDSLLDLGWIVEEALLVAPKELGTQQQLRARAA